MTSLLASTISSERANLDTLSAGTRAYFQARLKNRLYSLVLSKFRQKVQTEKLTQAQLARRMGRKPDVVNRLLGAPGNWTLDTVSDLLLAIAGEELDAASSDPETRPPRNERSVDRSIEESRSFNVTKKDEARSSGKATFAEPEMVDA